MNDQDIKYFNFTNTYQEAIIGYCFLDPKFFYKCRTKLKVEWFNCSPLTISVYKQLLLFYEKYGYTPRCTIINNLPMPEEMFNEPWFIQQSVQDQDKLRTALVSCMSARDAVTFEVLQKQMTGWLRKKLLIETYTIGASKLNKNGYEDSFEWTSKKIKEIMDSSFFDEFKVETYEDLIGTFKANDLNTTSISTGCDRLDLALGGGLFKGETAAMMAPTNMGKSKALITIVRHALVLEKKVLYCTHEDSALKVKERLIASIIGVSPKTIRMALAKDKINILKNPKSLNIMEVMSDEEMEVVHSYVQEQIKLAEELLKKQLVHLHYVKAGGMFAENLIHEIKKLQENEILKTGRGFDMIVDDYPKKLKLKTKSRDLPYRAELAEIYDMFNQLAGDFNVHCLVAIQMNRVGANMNKGRIETDRFTGNEEVDESYGISQNMGCLITLNRSNEDKDNNVLHYNISKSRNEKNDVSVLTCPNYSVNILHGDWELFKKYGVRMLLEPIAADYNETNKKIEPLEALKFLKERYNSSKVMIDNYLENDKELKCKLEILGRVRWPSA